jgi:histidine triad (HIT) family protein
MRGGGGWFSRRIIAGTPTGSIAMPTRRRLIQGLAAAAALPAVARAGPDDSVPAHGDCVFCRIEAGTEEAVVLWRDEHLLAIADKFPFAPGHALLMPRRHVRNLLDLPPGLAANLYAFAPAFARTLKRAFGADGITCIQNNEPAGGQTVFHFHMHFVPRQSGVELFRRLNERPEVPQAEREVLFAPVRGLLGART